MKNKFQNQKIKRRKKNKLINKYYVTFFFTLLRNNEMYKRIGMTMERDAINTQMQLNLLRLVLKKVR